MATSEIDVRALAAEAEEWVVSKGGREASEEALRQAESTSSQLSIE